MDTAEVLNHLLYVLTPVVGLGLGKLGGLEPSNILVEPVFTAAPLQFFYLRNNLV